MCYILIYKFDFYLILKYKKYLKEILEYKNVIIKKLLVHLIKFKDYNCVTTGLGLVI